MIGIVFLYLFKKSFILIAFPNFFIAAYLAVSGCRLYNITDKKQLID